MKNTFYRKQNMPILYVAKNPKYASVSRNKPNITDKWLIQEFIELECSEETYASSHVFVDRKNKKAYSDEKDIPFQYVYKNNHPIYSVTPDDDYFDPSIG